MFKSTDAVRAPDAESEAKVQDYIRLRRKWYQRINIIKDGAIQGWFVSFMWTIFTMIMACLGFLSDRVADRWVKFGWTYMILFLGTTTTWLAYRYGKAKIEAGQAESMGDAVKKIMDSVSALKK